VFVYVDQFSAKYAGASVVPSKMYWCLADLMYVTSIVEYFAGMRGRQNAQVKSLDGLVRWTADIYDSISMVSLFTMFLIALLSLNRVFKDLRKS
jgi:hypothetical protein